MKYRCENRRFSTNDKIGHPHGSSGVGGSVFPLPLYDGEYGTTWLEHVTDANHPDAAFYWFMTYDKAGNATVTMSAVLEKAQLEAFACLMGPFLLGK